MTTLILLDGDGEPVRRFALGPGRTTVGGPETDVPLPGVAAGELHLWGHEGRLERPAGAAAVLVDGREDDRFELVDGALVEWAGVRLRFTREAQLDEVEAPQEEARAWRRLKAGLAVDLGKADKRAAKRWQEAVVAGRFDPDEAADEILAASPLGDEDPALLERAARLARDLLMQPTLRGARGAARGARRTGRNVVAYLLSQLIVLAVFSLLFSIGLLVARYQGVAIDPLLDTVLPERAPEAPADGG